MPHRRWRQLSGRKAELQEKRVRHDELKRAPVNPQTAQNNVENKVELILQNLEIVFLIFFSPMVTDLFPFKHHQTPYKATHENQLPFFKIHILFITINQFTYWPSHTIM